MFFFPLLLVIASFIFVKAISIRIKYGTNYINGHAEKAKKLNKYATFIL